MNKLVICLLLSVFFLDYISINLGLISRQWTWIPELLSVLALLGVLAAMASGFSTRLPLRYKIFVIGFVLISFVGVVLNTVPAGPLITGIRNYFKFLPFYLLPFAYLFTIKELGRQFKWLIFLVILQVPLALFQRLVLYRTVQSGDPISGTVGISSMLSILMVCSIAMVVSLYVKKHISLKVMLFSCAYLSIPTMINETKSTLLFLPLAILMPFFLSKGVDKKFSQLLVVGSAVVVIMVAFVASYDYFMKPRWGYGLLEFLTMDGRVEHYLHKGTEADDSADEVGRFDSYFLALSVLSEDPIKLLFGLGIGNVSNSFLPGMNGEYWEKYAHLGIQITTISYFLWEIGLLGLLLHFWVLFQIYLDAKYLSTDNGILGALGLCWMVVTIIVFITMGYKRFLYTNVMGYLFWFYSGLVIAYAQQLRSARRQKARLNNHRLKPVGLNNGLKVRIRID